MQIFKHGIVCILLLSCTGFNSQLEQALKSQQISRFEIAGAGFIHTVFINAPLKVTAQPGRLRIYIGGDGSPWVNGTQVASDPTPRNPLALHLLMQDKRPAAFLARPCYFRPVREPECADSALWADARYAEPIIHSMQIAIERLQEDFDFSEFQLVGYSGGGVIATLLAERMPAATTLVTVAANLDIDRWTQVHGYRPLTDSLSPIEIATYRADLKHVHLVGGRDRVVPRQITDSFLAKRGGELWEYPVFDHACCWVREWSEIVERIENEF